MPATAQIGANLAALREALVGAAIEVGRDPSDVRLLAVSKGQSAAAVRAAHGYGQRAFGENYLQEAEAKQDALADLALEWHHIGRLQSNKTRSIAQRFDWIHGVDQLRIAERLSAHRPVARGPLSICLQVNLSAEPQKGGVRPEELRALALAVAQLPRLRLRGLMTIPAPATEDAVRRAPYRRLRELLLELRADGLDLDTLSMGMSDDFAAAVLEGATLVRIGTAVFGARA